MRTLFYLLALAFSVAFATKTVAVLPSDGTLSNDENELLTDKMREAALKVLPVNQFTLLKQDVVIKRLGGMENYIKECSENSCIVSLGRKAQVDYVAQCRVGKLGNQLRITVELYDVSTGGLLGMFSDIAENFHKLPPLMDKNIPDVFKNINAYKPEEPAPVPPEKAVDPVPAPVPPKKAADPVPAPVPPPVLVEPAPPPAPPPAKDSIEDKSWIWGSKANSLEDDVDAELGYKKKRREKKIDPQVEAKEESNKSLWAALALDMVGIAFVYYGYTRDKEMVNIYENFTRLDRGIPRSELDEAWMEVEDMKTKRNISYILGSVFLAAGIGVHIWF